MKSNISSLVGRSYVTKSGARCTVRRLGDGALQVNWAPVVTAKKLKSGALAVAVEKESQADRDEVTEWIVSVLKSQGENPSLTLCEDRRKEAETYAAWKKKLTEEP